MSGVRNLDRLAIFLLLSSVASAVWGQPFNVHFGPAGPADWAGNNWIGTVTAPPEAQFDEIGIVSNNGIAFVGPSGPPDPGGIVLGGSFAATGEPGAMNGTGELEIRNGGTMTVVNNGTTPGSVVVGGGTFTGTLDIQSGGTLVADSLTLNNAGSSIVSLAGTATANIANVATLNGTTRVTGQSVNFNAGTLALGDTHTLIADITNATMHSPLKTTGEAGLGGTLQLQFTGVTPALGNSWNLVDADVIGGNFSTIDASMAPALGAGQVYRVRKTTGGTNGQLAQVAVQQLLTLQVNRDTGAVSIANQGPAVGAANVAIDGFSVISANGSLDPGSFTGLGGAWQTANADAGSINQLNPTGTTNIAGGGSQSLGMPYDIAFPAFGEDPDEDVSFEYSIDNEVIQGFVEYSGDKVQNTLVLEVVPGTGAAQFFNDSPHTVNIDGYAIHSAGGTSLSVGSWSSLEDQAIGDWEESSPTSSVLSELNPLAVELLPGGAGSGMGNPFVVGQPQDLSFEFLLEGESTPMVGIVEYVSALSSITQIPIAGVPGDYNNDGHVNAADYVLWRNGGPLQNDPTPGVQAGDYDFWVANFGNPPGSGAGTAVPEPSGVLLLVASACLALAVAARWPQAHRRRVADTWNGLLLGDNQRSEAMIAGIRSANRTHARAWATVPPAIVAALLVVGLANNDASGQVIFQENFDGEVGLPTGWTLVDNFNGVPDPVVSIMPGHNGTGGTAGEAIHLVAYSGDVAFGDGNRVGAFIQAPSAPAVPASNGFMLDFDIKFGNPSEAAADDANVLFGDLSGGDYYSFLLTESDGNNDLFRYVDHTRVPGGSGTPVGDTNGYAAGMVDNTWYHGHLEWHAGASLLTLDVTDPATSMSTGGFSVTLDGSDVANGRILNSPLSGNVQFGFGTQNDNGTFDNIVVSQLANQILAGDVDGMNGVTIADFNIIRDNFRTSVTSRSDGDLNGDGFVDLFDFRQWKENFSGGSGAGTFAIPEPATAALAALVIMLGSCGARNRRRV